MRRLFLAALAFVLPVSTAAALALISGLITTPVGLLVYWPFDDATTSGASSFDVSSFGRTGVINGAITGTTGQIEQGYTFNGAGTTYVEGANFPNTTYPLQLSAWAKLASTTLANSTDAVIAAVVQKSSATEFWLSYYTAGGSTANNLRAVVQSGGVFRSCNASLTSNTNWHLIQAKFINSTTFTVHVDGTLVSCAPAGTANTPATVDTAYVGNFIYNGATLYTGLTGIIDDARFSNTLTSVGEDAALYNAGLAKHR